jgi:RelE toxin of RelEB toxin-antitoxin system
LERDLASGHNGMFSQVDLRVPLSSLSGLHSRTLSDIVLCMKRAFKTRNFARWMRKTELTEKVLRAAIVEMEQGLIDADLGAEW